MPRHQRRWMSLNRALMIKGTTSAWSTAKLEDTWDVLVHVSVGVWWLLLQWPCPWDHPNPTLHIWQCLSLQPFLFHFLLDKFGILLNQKEGIVQLVKVQIPSPSILNLLGRGCESRFLLHHIPISSHGEYWIQNLLIVLWVIIMYRCTKTGSSLLMLSIPSFISSNLWIFSQ